MRVLVSLLPTMTLTRTKIHHDLSFSRHLRPIARADGQSA